MMSIDPYKNARDYIEFNVVKVPKEKQCKYPGCTNAALPDGKGLMAGYCRFHSNWAAMAA